MYTKAGEWGSAADETPEVAPPQMWPPGMDVRTPGTMRNLEAALWHQLEGLRFRPGDTRLLQLRRRALIELFKHTAPWDAAELLDRLMLRFPGDALARSFHHRLATPTRRMLFDILRRRAGPTGQLESPDLALAAVEASRRGLRSAFAAVSRDCAGRRVLRRLSRQRLDPAQELWRLQQQLSAAQHSGDRDRVAQARCELASFRWHQWWRRRGSARYAAAYEELVAQLQRTQDQLDRGLWLERRWRCRTWPTGVRQPETVRLRCREQVESVARLRDTLTGLERRRRQLEDRILLGSPT